MFQASVESVEPTRAPLAGSVWTGATGPVESAFRLVHFQLPVCPTDPLPRTQAEYEPSVTNVDQEYEAATTEPLKKFPVGLPVSAAYVAERSTFTS